MILTVTSCCADDAAARAPSAIFGRTDEGKHLHRSLAPPSVRKVSIRSVFWAFTCRLPPKLENKSPPCNASLHKSHLGSHVSIITWLTHARLEKNHIKCLDNLYLCIAYVFNNSVSACVEVMLFFFWFVFHSNKKMYPVVLGQSNVGNGTLYLKKHKNNNFTASTVFKRWWLAPEGTFVSWKQRRLSNRQGDKEQGRSLHCNVKIILQNEIRKRLRKTHFRVNTWWRDVWADRLHTPPPPPPPSPSLHRVCSAA